MACWRRYDAAVPASFGSGAAWAEAAADPDGGGKSTGSLYGIGTSGGGSGAGSLFAGVIFIAESSV